MSTSPRVHPGDFWQRGYASYPAYVAHQKSKRDRMTATKLAKYEARYLAALQPRLSFGADVIWPGSRVLCLGARGGAEVRAFRALGCQAFGIDLNPGPDNPDVFTADFHALPFSDATMDVVFTNALDHVYDLDRMLAEVRRVLVLYGQFIVEAVRGTNEGCLPAAYESLSWPTIDALVSIISARGFTWMRRTPFDCPWPGEHLVCRVREAAL